MKIRLLEGIGSTVLATCEDTGRTLGLLLETVWLLRTLFRRFNRTAVQLVRVGPQSFPIAALMALFTGIVLAMHSGYALREYGSEEMLAMIVALSMVKEMAPVLTGLLVAGRIGAAFAAEIGTMCVNEEIDALESLGINPVRYLCVPRFTACVVMLPALVALAQLVGIASGAAVANIYFNITFAGYFDSVVEAISWREIEEGLVKAAVFGGLVAIISCHRGLGTQGGARGVGESITRCVVQCFVWIFISNYFVTRFYVQY